MGRDLDWLLYEQANRRANERYERDRDTVDQRYNADWHTTEGDA